MFEPVPEPTVPQIITVAEIVMLSTDEVETMITSESSQAMANAKWAMTLADIAAWPKFRSKAGKGNVKKVGPIEFFDSSLEDSRLSFRNTILQRYGYPALASETASAEMGAIASGGWF